MKSKSKEEEAIVVYKQETSSSYLIRYLEGQGENHFNRLLKSLRTYNMMAYKQFHFVFIPKLKEGELLGEIIDGKYHYELPSDNLFKKVHGKVEVIYTVEDNVVTLISLTPEELWNVGFSAMLETYRGVIIKSSKDKFKVDLVLKIGG